MSSDFELPPSATTKGKRGSNPTQPNPPSVAELTSDKASIETEEGKEKFPWTQAELLAIFDDIIFSGTYSEVVDIRGKLKLCFRARTAEEVETITNILDSTSANLIATVNEKRSLLNVYYALTMYQGKDLSILKQEQKQAFVNRLPAPIVGAIINALAKFDRKVYAACAEGEENF